MATGTMAIWFWCDGLDGYRYYGSADWLDGYRTWAMLANNTGTMAMLIGWMATGTMAMVMMVYSNSPHNPHRPPRTKIKHGNFGLVVMVLDNTGYYGGDFGGDGFKALHNPHRPPQSKD